MKDFRLNNKFIECCSRLWRRRFTL